MTRPGVGRPHCTLFGVDHALFVPAPLIIATGPRILETTTNVLRLIPALRWGWCPGAMPACPVSR
jgi:hypothetical protein